MCLIYFAAGSVITFARLLPGALLDWLLRDVAAPLAAAIAMAALARAFIPLPGSREGTVLVTGVVLLCTVGVTVVAARAAATNL